MDVRVVTVMVLNGSLERESGGMNVQSEEPLADDRTNKGVTTDPQRPTFELI